MGSSKIPSVQRSFFNKKTCPAFIVKRSKKVSACVITDLTIKVLVDYYTEWGATKGLSCVLSSVVHF